MVYRERLTDRLRCSCDFTHEDFKESRGRIHELTEEIISALERRQ